MYNKLVFLVLIVAKISALKQLPCKDVPKHKNYPLLPHGSQCVPISSNKKIMGGEDASLGEFPWMALFIVREERLKIEVPWCGASLLNEKYVLTAAHCLTNYLKKFNVTVRLGEYDLESNDDCEYNTCIQSYKEYLIEEQTLYPGYDTNINENDIALVRLKGKVQFSEYIKPACLPISCKLMEKDFLGEYLTIAGFGLIQDSPVQVDATILQKVQNIVVPGRLCTKANNKTLLPTQICVGGTEMGLLGKSSCHGDSGGPLMYTDHEDSTHAYYYVVAIVSGGPNCSATEMETIPGYHTRVTSYITWILDNIRE